MELQFDKSTVSYLENAARQVRSAELTQEVKLSDGMPDIGRVLTSWGQIVLRSKEWNRDEVMANGGLMVWTLYVPEDGTEVRSVESWIPFQLKWDVDGDDREGPIRIAPLLRFVDSRGTSARKIMVRAGISALGQALSPESAEVYTPGELPEDVQLRRETYPVRLPKEAGEKTFLIDEELSLPENLPQMEKLLAFTLGPEITDRKVIGSRVVFKGNGNLHLLYRCPEGKVRVFDAELPFSQFGELDRDYGPDAKADIQMGVTSLEADMMEPGKIRLKAGMVGQYLIDDRELLDLTEDAYSPFRQVEPQREDLELPTVLEDRKETVTAEQSVPGQSGQPVDVNFLPDFPRLRRTGQNAELELPGLFQVLYYGEDGSLQATNARWEGSMSIPADEDTALDFLVQPMGRARGMAGVDGINLTGQMQLRQRSTSQRDIPMVTGLELGELGEPDAARASVILTRAGEEQLWDIAKRCGSTVGAIKEANNLDAEPKSNQMLLIPVL